MDILILPEPQGDRLAVPSPADGRDLHSFCTNYAQLPPVI